MVFFVISGFVLRLSLEHGPQKLFAAAVRFFSGRLFRIYPVVMVSVLLIALLSLVQLHPLGGASSPLTAQRFVANLFLFDISLNGTLWALQVELVMAPVILLLYFLERNRGPYTLFGIALATTALAFWPRWAVWPPLATNVFPFVLGMVVPTLGRRLATTFSKRAATWCGRGATTALLLSGPCLGLFSRYSSVLEAYAAVVLVSLVAYRQDLPVFKCLDAKPLRLLGKSSGSYYVLHMALIPPSLVLAQALIPPAWSAAIPAVVGFLVLPVWLVAIAPLAVYSYDLIEARGIVLGHRFAGFFRLDTHSDSSHDGQRDVPHLAA
jgi:peptidoglycan/LPS O-acetylase OafA/YrhL